MLSDDLKASLEEAWGPARRAGVLGSAPIEALVEHTAGFARAVCSSFSADAEDFSGRIIDVGTGAGLPGVLLSLLLPRAEFVLVDASDRRLDHVRRAVRTVGTADRVTVLHARGDALAHDVTHRGAFDAAVARLLADPAEAVEQLVPLVRPGGCCVVSTQDEAVDRWETLPVPLLPTGPVSWHVEGPGRFAVVPVQAAADSAFPRREKLRRRSPAF